MAVVFDPDGNSLHHPRKPNEKLCSLGRPRSGFDEGGISHAGAPFSPMKAGSSQSVSLATGRLPITNTHSHNYQLSNPFRGSSSRELHKSSLFFATIAIRLAITPCPPTRAPFLQSSSSALNGPPTVVKSLVYAEDYDKGFKFEPNFDSDLV